MIPFNKPPYTGNEEKHLLKAMQSTKLSGGGEYTILCESWFEKKLAAQKTLMTPSCTDALELAALLVNIQPGDEVIMPSYTFVSTANAFALRGANIVFVDIRPDTMNIDERLIEAAITERTKAIVPVHYAGVGCEMDSIMAIAEKYGLFVIEDAAQAFMANYRGRPLGSIGHLGAFSFHDTKNYTSGGEGGLLIVNDASLLAHSEILREKGTNRKQFLRGAVDKYTWVDIGSSFLPSELQAAYLWGQLECVESIRESRLYAWEQYKTGLVRLEEQRLIELNNPPTVCDHNAHMFYLKVNDIEERTSLIEYLHKKDIAASFHYIPLHSAPAGKKFGIFSGEDVYTTKESSRLLRLPMFHGISKAEVATVIQALEDYYS